MRVGRLMKASRLPWLGSCARVVQAGVQPNGGIQWIPLLERGTGRAWLGEFTLAGQPL
jgi:hypothetical protein